jgi:hypothetical protein
MQLQVLSAGRMNRQERGVVLSAVRQRFVLVDPYLTEQSRRVWAAAEALAIGPRGNTIVAEATGMSRTTIIQAQRQLAGPAVAPPERQRRPGGGRKPVSAGDPTLLDV